MYKFVNSRLRQKIWWKASLDFIMETRVRKTRVFHQLFDAGDKLNGGGHKGHNEATCLGLALRITGYCSGVERDGDSQHVGKHVTSRWDTWSVHGRTHQLHHTVLATF